jgi:hypothetical protein
MRKCFLHIGTHKTGTTAIQLQLQKHARELEKRRFLYPRAGVPRRLAGHHNISWQLRGDRRFKPEHGTLDDLFLEIGKSDKNIILSSEDFECATDVLGSFISRLERHGFSVEVIVYFRDQLSYCRSLYLELITLGYDQTFSDFLLEILEHGKVRWQDSLFSFDYQAMLDQLPPATTIIARPFRRQNSVIGDFLSMLGLTPSDLKIDPDFRSNIQGPISVAVAQLDHNRTGRNIQKNYKAIMRSLASAFDGREIDLSEHSRQKLVAAFAASNRWMVERFGITMSTDPIEPQSCQSAGLNLEEVFSAATLRLIDTQCAPASRGKWSVFGWSARR